VKNHRISAFDGLRGYFVLLTFCVHFIPNAAGFVGLNISGPISQLSRIGKLLHWLQISNYGVYGFFILSGFLIARMALNNPGFVGKTFLFNRFMRIYPAFLISVILSGSVGMFYTHYMHINLVDTLKNLLFLNGFFLIGEIPSLNFVTWSLFYEFLFYLTVPIMVFAILRLRLNRLGSLLLIYALTAFISVALRLTMSYQLFFVGIVIASFSDQELRDAADSFPEWLVILVYVAATSAYSLGIDEGMFIPIFCITAPVFIIKAAFGNGILSKIFNWKYLRLIGQVSYSFYLLHATIIIAFFFTLQSHGFVNKYWAVVALPITSLLTLGMSYLLYVIAERPYFLRKARVELVNKEVAVSK